MMWTPPLMRVIYIRGENILMTVTGIKLDTKSGAFSATAQWQPPEYKGIPYSCEVPIEGQLTGFVLQLPTTAARDGSRT